MNYIVVSDIFGSTAALNQFLTLLSPFYNEMTVIEPYGGQETHFVNEASAYQYFQQNYRIESLPELLEAGVKKSKETKDIKFVHFSAFCCSAFCLTTARA